MQSKTDHLAVALSRLLPQYEDKPRIRALLSSYINQVQAAEDAAYSVYFSRRLESAYGATLDLFGRVLLESRAGSSDAAYKARLQAKLAALLSDGEADSLLTVARLLTTDIDVAVALLSEPDPATVVIQTTPAFLDVDTAVSILKRAKSAGVRLLVEHATAEEADSFSFSSGSTVELDVNAGGFGDEADPDVGGSFAGVIDA